MCSVHGRFLYLERRHEMKLRIRYENTYQNIELSPADTQDLWVCLSLEGDDLSEKEREARIQEAWEIRFNRPDYAIPQHSPKSKLVHIDSHC